MNSIPLSVVDRLEDGSFITRDLQSRLLEDRIVFMCGDLDEQLGNNIVMQLLYLSGLSDNMINIYINSDGGEAVEALAIYDTIKFIKPVVRTVCIGQACSSASLILGAGSKGNRFALPNSRVLIHQVRGGVTGTTEEVRMYSDEIRRIMDVVTSLFSDCTGQSMEKIREDLNSETYMSAKQALGYGLIDHIIEDIKLL